MRLFLTLITSGLILTAAYFVAFGLPPFLSVVSGIETTGNAQAGKTASGSPNDGPRDVTGRANSTTVVLTPLELQPYADILRAIGRADALRSANVIAKVAGEVIETNLTANDQVEAGDVLMQLDPRSEAFNLEIAQAELDQATETVERYARLQGSGNSTVTDVTLSDAKVAQRLAEANVGLAQIALEDRSIRAPISGKLGLSDIVVGDVLPANSTIVTIDDAKSLLVEFELPERSIGLLSKQQEVLANTPTFVGRTFAGEIVSFDSRIDDVTRSVTVKARIENPDAQLWPGMTFAIRVIHESDPLAVLPATAITWSRSGSSVWVDHDGTAEHVAVTILFRRGDLVWIEADIAPGVQIVTEGAQKLRAGSRISSAEAEKPAAPGDPT